MWRRRKGRDLVRICRNGVVWVFGVRDEHSGGCISERVRHQAAQDSLKATPDSPTKHT